MSAANRSSWISTCFGGVAFAAIASTGACSKPDAKPDAAAMPATLATAQMVAAPDESTLGNDAVSLAVRRGRSLLNSTLDSLPTHVGNDLRCTSCHLSDGRRAFAMPWVGVSARYPQMSARSGRKIELTDRINECFQRNLNAPGIDPAGRDMKDIVAYMSWLSKGVAAGGVVVGQGVDMLAPLTPDTAAGAKLFAKECAQCHGSVGSGAPGPRLFNGSESTIAAPLWGSKSFNVGSEFARLSMVAAFIHTQMALNAPGSLTPQMAFDVAGMIIAQPRPDFAKKAGDWPAGGAPADVPYPTTGGGAKKAAKD